MNTFNTYHGIPMYKIADFVDVAREFDEEFAECLETHLRKYEDVAEEAEDWYESYRQADNKLDELKDELDTKERLMEEIFDKIVKVRTAKKNEILKTLKEILDSLYYEGHVGRKIA